MDWKPLLDRQFPVSAQPTGLWTLVLDYVEGPCLLKIAAAENDSWSYSPTSQCGADGDPRSMLLTDRCLHPTAPVGALIAKIGGSSAGIKEDGVVSLVGKAGVITVEAPGGPLYMTMNDEVSGMWNNAGTMRVLVWSASKPGTAPAGTPDA